MQIPGSAPFAVFLERNTNRTFCYVTCTGVFIWAPVMCTGEREECVILSLPHLTCPPTATASPWYPLPLWPTQREILRLIMVSADKMKKAIKCVQRGTLWSFGNIPLPLILNTVDTLMIQTNWPRGCKAGRSPSLYASSQPDHCEQNPRNVANFPLPNFTSNRSRFMVLFSEMNYFILFAYPQPLVIPSVERLHLNNISVGFILLTFICTE